MTAESGAWRKGKRVAIIGAGPTGVSAAIAFLKQGFDVRLFEKNPEPQPLGGAVLLSVPVLAVLREYGIDVGPSFGSKTGVQFRNNKGKVRAELPFNPNIEKSFGIPGWHYGVLRKSAFGKMMNILPDNVIVPDHGFSHYEETGDEVIAHFENGAAVTADILVGADGVRSKVSEQAFGDPGLFHVGLRVWLAWCDHIEGLDRTYGAISHGRKIQASWFPMLHDGKPGFEWWIVEPVTEDQPVPENPEAYLRNLLKDFADPLPRFPDHTNFESQIFPWNIYNRPLLKSWSKGRVVCVGDAVHPVSPYAAYGMGMGIEDGYFLAREFKNASLEDAGAVTAAFNRFEAERVDYVNHQVEFARELGQRFHHAPAPVAMIRDFVFDNTSVLGKLIQKDYLADQEKMSLALTELHV
ncbi:FAD-dependent monooxygenase [Ponticaulis sp.]|uniref:FAD-dependent oxidoreductase n=1 Tax=Ponticaulis sp. TaxID=2020902 RepID=UPI00260C06AF|nr:FAD-dependent monooxygenase [Ponticaulis sp.]MDF1679058.1 FAD-dependent monooxygenase [Ponticaulis sp.]